MYVLRINFCIYVVYYVILNICYNKKKELLYIKDINVSLNKEFHIFFLCNGH